MWKCFILKEQSYVTYSRTPYVGVLLLKVQSTWLNRTKYAAVRKLTAGTIKGTEIHTDKISKNSQHPLMFVHVFFFQLKNWVLQTH